MLPVDVVFLHMRRSTAAEVTIAARAADLSRRFRILTSCRVIVEVPNKHLDTGKRFRVRIELGVPRRRDLVVERGPARRATATADDRPMRRKSDEVDGAFTDLDVVVHEAFLAARRRLESLADRRRAAAHRRAVVAKGDTATRRRIAG